jgi:Rieske Fe-S protein
MTDVSRRQFLGCAALFGVAGPLLVACSSSSDSGTTSGGSSGSGTGGSGGSAGDVLVTTDKVPVGGGVVLTDIVVAVTQPTKGQFKAFDAHCTHQGTTLGQPNSQGVMTCPLHGSQFNDEGKNIVGPNGGAAGTTANLTEIPIKVQGNNVVRA